MIDWSLRFVFCLPALLSMVLASCASSNVGGGNALPTNAPESLTVGFLGGHAVPSTKKRFTSASRTRENDGRKRIYQASQTVEVPDVAVAVQKAEAQIQAHQGHVENSSVNSDETSFANLTLRVPASERRALMETLAALGKETHRRTTAEDTTTAYVDLEARVKNTEALRDRLRHLLETTDAVSDVLKIEKELARVQSDLDAMQARFSLMKSQVQLAKIDLTLRTKEIPGPIGAAGKGLWWSIRKLFVLK